MAELAYLFLGLLIGTIADRRFARMESEALKPGMVYTLHLLPDPKEVLWKYLLQVVIHTFTGKGGRCATITTRGATMWHGFRSSTGRFTSRELLKLPAGAKLRPQGPCYESTINALQKRNGERFNIFFRHCRWSI